MPSQKWGERAVVDRRSRELHFRGTVYDYPGLLTQRRGEDIGQRATPDRMRENFERTQRAIRAMADAFDDADVTRAVIVGNDHKEAFTDEVFGAITVYSGASIMQVPFDDENLLLMTPGTEEARDGHTPRQPVSHAGDPELGDQIISDLTRADFDITRSTMLPPGRYGNRSIPHAFGFVYRRIMSDRVVPNVPIFLNTFYPPNRPSPSRCVRLGRELASTIAADERGGRTAVFATGGLSHFVVDEELDKRLLDAVAAGDVTALEKFEPELLESGSSEMLGWLVVATAMIELGLSMNLVDYVPCYRTEAGTGSGMGFVTWT